MNSNNQKYFEVNKVTWNKKVAIHAKSNMYDTETFKNGKSSLKCYEKTVLGNLENKSLLHLQRHFGQDTLSWSRLIAKCTGVDFSDAGINFVKELNKDLKLDAKFIGSNVL